MLSEYGKIKRHELKALIEREYGIEVVNFHESDRGILIQTDQGVKRFKKIKSDESKMLFAASAYEYIYNNGFHSISRINKTRSGDYTVRYDKHIFILQDFTKGRVFAIESAEEAAEAAAALAKLHQCGSGFIPAPGSRARVDWGKWMEKFKSYAINMRKYREMVERKEEKSRFDRVFLDYADRYHEKMVTACQLLRDNGYLAKVRESMNCNQVIHNEFKKHAIMKDEKQGIFITNLEECSYDIRETDFATLLESFSGKNKTDLAHAAIMGYAALNPLDRDSLKIIQAFLIYPKKFYKVIESCYGKKKNYNEGELLKKLERSIKKEQRKEGLILAIQHYM